MRATDFLRDEHEVILRVLDVLESASKEALRTKKPDVDTWHKAIDFLNGFADLCHH